MGADLFIRHPEVLKAKAEWDTVFKRKENELHRLQNDVPLLSAIRRIVLGASSYSHREEAHQFLATKKGGRVKQLICDLEQMLDDEPGYFRDSYSETSLFARLHLSWWKLSLDDGLIEEGKITPEKAAELLQTIKRTELDFFSASRPPPRIEDVNPKVTDQKARATAHRWNMDEWRWQVQMSEKNRKKWNAFFVKQKALLERFLQTAIDLNWPIDASV